MVSECKSLVNRFEDITIVTFVELSMILKQGMQNVFHLNRFTCNQSEESCL